jgi:hypothetical protein
MTKINDVYKVIRNTYWSIDSLPQWIYDEYKDIDGFDFMLRTYQDSLFFLSYNVKGYWYDPYEYYDSKHRKALNTFIVNALRARLNDFSYFDISVLDFIDIQKEDIKPNAQDIDALRHYIFHFYKNLEEFDMLVKRYLNIIEICTNAEWLDYRNDYVVFKEKIKREVISI